MKNVVIVALGSLLLAGCGGGSKSVSFEEQLKTKNTVNVLYNYPPATCKRLPDSDTLKNLGYTDIISKVESGDISCGQLGLPETTLCVEYYEGFNASESCVVGYNQ